MTDPTPMLIGTDRITADETIEVRSPYDERLVGVVARGGTGHLEAAAQAAKGALAAGPMPAHQRAEILDVAARLLAERVDQFAELISSESAKPITTARGEAQRAVDTVSFSAAVARTLGGELIPMDASSAGVGKLGFVKRVPIGVVAAISPFNFPLNLVCHKVAPAIAAGCPVVLKPASTTPLTALALGDLLVDECGLPPGWLNVVPCPGSLADHLITDDDTDMITFTGSPEVGWSIRARAPKKKVSLELGNNSPIVIEPDGDWAAAATKVKMAGYAFAGQSCISTQRVYVHEDIYDDFTNLLVAEVKELNVGDPASSATDVSALIDRGETMRVESWINEAVGSGAKLATGGERSADGVLEPTVLADVTADMKVCSHEVFGPVVGVAPYLKFDDALDAANASEYGLQAAVFTSDLGKALHAADVLDYGGVLINEVPTWRADHMPYGGLRDSGNTREGPAYAVREMTEERLIVMQP